MRPFNQLNESNRKCSLDGERDALFYRERVTGDSRPSFLYKKAERVNGRILKPAEALSAISFLKRNYLKTPTNEFESTAEIAMMQTIESIDKQEIAGVEYHRYKGYFNIMDWDAQLLDEDNLTLNYFIKNGLDAYLRNPGLIKLKEEHFKLIEKCKPFFFPKYYAVLVFDVDQMGKWLSGEFLKEEVDLMYFQRLLSEKLTSFAKRLDQIL